MHMDTRVIKVAESLSTFKPPRKFDDAFDVCPMTAFYEQLLNAFEKKNTTKGFIPLYCTRWPDVFFSLKLRRRYFLEMWKIDCSANLAEDRARARTVSIWPLSLARARADEIIRCQIDDDVD